MDKKTRGVVERGEEVGMAGVVGRDEGKGRKLYLNNNKSPSIKKNNKTCFLKQNRNEEYNM